MGTSKRERQKTARQEKIEELRRQEQRQATRRRGLLIGAAIVAFLAFAIGFSVLTAGDDDEDVTTTEEADGATDTTEGEDGADADDATEGDDPTDDGTDTTEAGGEDEAAAEPLPCPPEDGTAERTTEFPAAPPSCLEDGVDYVATMETDVGTIEIDLLEDEAPATVNNFVYLARYGYYDGLDFHRVIPDFVIQGGDPQGDGTGGPGYQFEDELPEPEDYQAGSLAMANSGPDTNGSQFFIVTSEQGAESLVQAVGGTANYSLFGTVTEGMDVVAEIEADGSPTGQPQTTHVIESVTISER
ncbi:MAG: peptidylprolyl isomerase [Acidimicrobiia bacterium]